MLNATVCFLLRDDEICLGFKKRGFGFGKFNGFGGKVGDKDEFEGETVEDATRREAKEEFGIVLGKIEKMAEIQFDFPLNPGWGMFVHAFLCRDWEGKPVESEELQPRWFKISEIPWDKMWADNGVWLPQILDEKRLTAHFIFDDKENITHQEIEIIDEFHPAHSQEAVS